MTSAAALYQEQDTTSVYYDRHSGRFPLILTIRLVSRGVQGATQAFHHPIRGKPVVLHP